MRRESMALRAFRNYEYFYDDVGRNFSSLVIRHSVCSMERHYPSRVENDVKI